MEERISATKLSLMSIELPSLVLPEVFATGTLMIDGQRVALAQRLTVRQLVAERPQRARVFEKYGISYCCCSGNKTFLEACVEKEVDPRLVLADLRECDTNSYKLGNDEDWDWLQNNPAELRLHIIEMHDAFLRVELPRLSYLLERVTARHGVFYNELWELQSLFEEFKSELQTYLENEEKCFFTLFDGFTERSRELQIAANNVIRSIESTHILFGQMISQINAIANAFRVPETACNTLKVMLESLSELTRNVHLYMRIKIAYCCNVCSHHVDLKTAK